jgi:hypothetical protein
MKFKQYTLVFVITAMAIMFLSTDSMAEEPWYNCMSIDITNPEAGDRFETHDRVRVRWTAYYSGDNLYPGQSYNWVVSCYSTSECNCLIYQSAGEYTNYTNYDPPLYYYPWWIDYTMDGRHDWLVPGFITAKYPDAYLKVWSQDTPYGGWQTAGVSIRIKMIYDPLPDPHQDPPFMSSISEAPTCTYLNKPYPNPFNPQTSIQFGLKEAATVSLKIYNVRGQLVKTLHDNKNMPAGKYQDSWQGVNNDGTGVPTGIYFLKLMTSNGYSETRKMVLLQ